jgi:hypothetical protein
MTPPALAASTNSAIAQRNSSHDLAVQYPREARPFYNVGVPRSSVVIPYWIAELGLDELAHRRLGDLSAPAGPAGPGLSPAGTGLYCWMNQRPGSTPMRRIA